MGADNTFGETNFNPDIMVKSPVYHVAKKTAEEMKVPISNYEITQIKIDTPVKVIPNAKVHISENGWDFFMKKPKKDIEEYPPKHDHIWQKTMDLKWDENYWVSSRRIVRMYSHIYAVLKQKLVCPYCGEEKWEEVE